MKQYKKYIVVALMLLITIGLIAAKPSGVSHWSSIWIGDKTGTSDFTVGPNDGWVVADFGVGGTFYNSHTETFNIPIAAVYVNGVGVISATSSPSLLAVAPGGTPAIVYGASTVTTSFGYSYVAQPDFSSGLAFRMFYKTSLASSSPASLSFNWEIWVNKANTIIDAAPFKQTTVTASSTEYSTSNQVMTFTANTTAVAGIAAGDLITVYWSPSDTRAYPSALYNVEIPGIEGRYTAARL